MGIFRKPVKKAFNKVKNYMDSLSENGLDSTIKMIEIVLVILLIILAIVLIFRRK